MVDPHVFACLVHEAPDCVVDLVDNLRFLDPDSVVLLYDGSRHGTLLRDTDLADRDGVLIHPAPRPMVWGALHGFALDCMRFARDHLDFGAITIVDSDQLAVRARYSSHLAAFLALHPDAGCLVNDPQPQPSQTRVAPARVAWHEVALWRPFLQRFPEGERKFPHWTFWPSTVFTRSAACDLVELWEDDELQAIMSRTGIWATEEVILPTLVALAGHEILRSPCAYDLVRYRITYSRAQIDAAASRPDVFWVHPVPRRFGDPVRTHIRRRFGEYLPATRRSHMGPFHGPAQSPLPLLLPLLRRMDAVSGRLSHEEADLLAASASHALTALPPPHRVLAVAPNPRTMVVLRGAAQLVSPEATVGESRPADAGDHSPVSLLVVDELPDYAAIADAFSAVEADVVVGGLVVFHGYDARGGVRTFVDHLVADGGYQPVQQVQTVAVVRKERGAGFPRIGPIVKRMARVPGWLEPDEAALLAVAATWALRPPTANAIVEVGSYCGRGTVVLGGIVAASESNARVYAVDPFDGVVGAAGAGLTHTGPTLDRFTATIADAGLTGVVRTRQGKSVEIEWDQPIGLLVIDGLHDQPNVAADFRHFAPSLVPGAYVAFHDYADYYPGVQAFVAQLLRHSGFERVAQAGSLILLRADRGGSARAKGMAVAKRRPPAGRSATAAPKQPLVSCVMPTYNRRIFVPQAIRYFLRQDYADRELVVVDDGTDPVADLIPDDPRIRYIRLPDRRSIGAKRNIGCENARGDLLVHWDDDDWMADWRLRYQVETFLDQDVDVCGLSVVFFCEVPGEHGWRYEYPKGRRPWVHDPTFCYRRGLWASAPFPDSSHSLDARYLWQGRAKSVGTLNDPSFYVGIVHSGNTSRKDTTDSWWRPYPTDEIAAMMGTDWSFYRRSPDAGVGGGRR